MLLVAVLRGTLVLRMRGRVVKVYCRLCLPTTCRFVGWRCRGGRMLCLLFLRIRVGRVIRCGVICVLFVCRTFVRFLILVLLTFFRMTRRVFVVVPCVMREVCRLCLVCCVIVRLLTLRVTCTLFGLCLSCRIVIVPLGRWWLLCRRMMLMLL